MHAADVNECLASGDNGGCEQECVNTMGGYRCVCRPGYSLQGDGHTCEDNDECSFDRGGCQQLCVNTASGYHCDCEPGYELFDRQTCADINECNNPARSV